MLFDTHCHLNFKAFDGQIEQVIDRAKEAGVGQFIVPGTDVETSKKAVELAERYDNVYAAVGVHPHHVFKIINKKSEIQSTKSETNPNVQNSFRNSNLENLNIVSNIRISSFGFILNNIERLLRHPKVVAIGEIGLDRHYYQDTKYKNYQINDEFMKLQKYLFIAQIKLAEQYSKKLIIHTREAAGETLQIIGETLPDFALTNRVVFHCCEAENSLLDYALAHQIYIGVDGDVTYSKKKQDFIKKVPLELIVLETDSPFLLPRLRPTDGESSARQAEPLRFPNEPKNIVLIAQTIAKIKNVSINRLVDITTKNAENLFQVR